LTVIHAIDPKGQFAAECIITQRFILVERRRGGGEKGGSEVIYADS
jgi:hypothetical protein